MKVYVVGAKRWCGPSTVGLFQNAGHEVVGDEILSNDPNSADLVVFTGGADISPHIYGEENISSSCDTYRDSFELEVFYALKDTTKKAGICRGAQLLNALNGGKLIQHHGYVGGLRAVAGYTGDGYKTADFGVVDACHHQGILCPVDGEALMWIGLNNYKEGTVSPEQWPVYALNFPKTNSFGVQWHPEWGHKNSRELFFSLMNEHLLGNAKVAA